MWQSSFYEYNKENEKYNKNMKIKNSLKQINFQRITKRKKIIIITSNSKSSSSF